MGSGALLVGGALPHDFLEDSLKIGFPNRLHRIAVSTGTNTYVLYSKANQPSSHRLSDARAIQSPVFLYLYLYLHLHLSLKLVAHTHTIYSTVQYIDDPTVTAQQHNSCSNQFLSP